MPHTGLVKTSCFDLHQSLYSPGQSEVAEIVISSKEATAVNNSPIKEGGFV